MNASPYRRLAIGAVASLSLVLTACSSGSAGSATKISDKPVTINITWWGADARAKLTNEAIAAFEKKYPNITVKVYDGGHMTYLDDGSRVKQKADVKSFYQGALAQ